MQQPASQRRREEQQNHQQDTALAAGGIACINPVPARLAPADQSTEQNHRVRQPPP